MKWAACAALVEAGDPDRFLAGMTAPVAARAKLFPLYAFNLELAKAPWVTSEPMLAEIRLQWWRDVLEEIYAGKPDRKHEVVEPLAQVIREGKLASDALSGMIEARRADALRESFQDPEHSWHYAQHTAGALAAAAVQALGAGPDAISIAEKAATAAGIGALLAAQPALSARGIRRIPQGAEQYLAGRALSEIRNARRRTLEKIYAAALRHVWRTERILRCAAQNPHRLEMLTDTSDISRKFGYIWRTALGRW